ncbi:MAG TPA: hypothetical protein PLV92_16630, partial [Pirellulaceae bacterium]|nr:hypothetical protein [Pirellulaceae bacterium]
DLERDRLVFDVKVQEDKSDSEFHVVFTLYDNIDNAAPDANGDGRADLLGANEQTLDLPVKLTAEDSDGSTLSTVMHLGVEDDIPFFGETGYQWTEGSSLLLTIDNVDPAIAHDESWFPQGDADDQSIFNPNAWNAAQDAYAKVTGAGFSLPYGDSVGAVFGIAQNQVAASFGADQSSREQDKDADDPTARNSIFGELEDRTDADGDGLDDGENEHPFELFMIATGGGAGAVPTEDNLLTPGNEGNLTIADQVTNATVTWNGEIETIKLHQIDAQTIVGYIEVENQPQQDARESIAVDLGTGKEAVFVITINDDGTLTFVQYHQINHDTDGPTSADHDDGFQILGEDGTPVIQVRISDNDGDHATKPLNVVVQDDGPKFCGVDWGYDYDATSRFNGTGLIDEDKLQPNGNGDHAYGDDPGRVHTDGKISFSFGVDQPGHLAIQAMEIKDDSGHVVLSLSVDGNGDLIGANDLHTADGQPVIIGRSGPDVDGVVTWTAYVNLGTAESPVQGDPVFTFTLDSEGAGIGEFDFCLLQPLAHPFTDDPSTDADNDATSFEDNLHVDVTVRGYDVDGDWSEGHINISVDDDSPDGCKVDIRLGGGEGEDALLVQDETAGVQDKGDGVSGASDPDASAQDEDDVADPSAALAAFEVTRGLLSNLGHAQTNIVVDLSGGSADADAAIGADRPGSVGAVSLVDSAGNAFDGDATNLRDTQTNRQIFLFTETVDGE